MDKQGYKQLDRIENMLIELSGKDNEINTLMIFYEDEILNEDGELNHLSKDKVVKDFFERLKEEELEEYNEYENIPFGE